MARKGERPTLTPEALLEQAKQDLSTVVTEHSSGVSVDGEDVGAYGGVVLLFAVGWREEGRGRERMGGGGGGGIY